MDVLDDLLAGTRARGGVFNLTIMDPPWALHIRRRGSARAGDPGSRLGLDRPGRDRAGPDGGRRRRRIFNGPEPYVVGDDPGTEPQLRIHPGGICEPLPGAPVDYSARLGVRTYGGRPEGEAMVVSGTYQLEGDVSRRLLTALPSVLVVPAGTSPGM